MSDSQVFMIHDNGGTPFAVTVNGGSVTVIETQGDSVVWEVSDSTRVFVGESPVTDMTTFSGGHGPIFRGNSILVKTNDNEYTYIGARIYSFRSESEIVRYVSEVGNNDVPYPYAVDEEDNFYLMIEDVVLLQLSAEHHADPYRYLYSIRGEPAARVLGFEYFVGADPDEYLSLSYTSHPRVSYQYPWMADLHAVTHSHQYPVSEGAYVNMMEELAESFNLRPLEILETIVDRPH